MALLIRPRHAPALALAAALALFAGCSQRERSNPLDPRNPNTSGAPTGFKAVALSGQVTLTWDRSGDLRTQLFRRAQGTADFSPISTIIPSRNTLFTDTNAANGTTWEYRLFFANENGTLGPPAAAAATPSKVVAYTADNVRGSLIRISADGQEIAAEQPGFGRPIATAIDRDRDQVWVSDELNGRVILYVPSTGIPVSINGFQQATSIAVDPGDGSAWVSDRLAGSIRHIANGGGTGTLPEITGLDEPSGIGVNPVNRDLWVCEFRGSTVRRYGANGSAIGATPMTNPWRVAVDSANGEAWATSFESNRVLHLSPGLATLHSLSSSEGLVGPSGIAVDARRGRIWVADYAGNRLLALRRDGTEEFRVNGIVRPLEVSVELASGEAWVALNSGLVRVSPGGSVLTTTRGVYAPAGVVLDRLP